MTQPDVVPFRAAIVRIFPELAGASFTLMTTGWHSAAVDVDDRLIFKFPRHAVAERALLKEAALLQRIRPALSMTVPDLRIHSGPPLFSRHEKLKGGHLLAADYTGLPEDARRRLGDDLARFYAELHRLDISEIAAAGAGPIEKWQTPQVIRAKALPALPSEIRALAEQTVAAFERLPPDPHGTTYGFFDGHGWNMAFDHAHGRLNGIYDFADSGLGPLHQEFIYTNLISPDLTERVITAYEALTGHALDRGRITLLTGIHRLSELAELADDPEHASTMIGHVAKWAAMAERGEMPTFRS